MLESLRPILVRGKQQCYGFETSDPLVIAPVPELLYTPAAPVYSAA